MKPGSIAGSRVKAPPGCEAEPATPRPAPLSMPRGTVHAPRTALRTAGSRWTAMMTGAMRILLFVAWAALTTYGVREMHGVMATGGVTGPQWIFLTLFAVNFAWVSFAGLLAVAGFLRMALRGFRPARHAGARDLQIKTAILAPVYNEDPASVAARLSAMGEQLGDAAPGKFAIFILSDTNEPTHWVQEEAVFRDLIATADHDCPIYYRHRRDNTERKAGNIADWVSRWGADYEAMLVLDADSLMSAQTMVTMAARLQADPGLGLLQTLPVIIRARSLFARLQQFANQCYGNVFGHGLAAWHGRSGNFWGHNAIIRTRAFAEAAKLPELRGRPPLGGHVLSHDFMEAAFLRRAGWAVRLDPDLRGSYEEAPPSLMDLLTRDRRWCQGNLQHNRFVFARGFPLVSRMHLLMGIMAYVSPVLWFALLSVGLGIAVQAALTRPEYFAQPGLFPTWPVFDSPRALALFFISMTVVLAPKILGWLALMLNPIRMVRFGGPIAVTISLIVELLLSAAYASILMVSQTQMTLAVLTGADSGWRPQKRDDGRVGWRQAWRAHRWHMGIGLTLAGVAYAMHPFLFLWLTPVTFGLIFSIPLSVLSGSVVAGRALKRFAILRTPEEQRRGRPSILQAFEARLGSFGRPEAGPMAMLASDPDLLAWHTAQLSESRGDRPQFDEDLVLARAKASWTTDMNELDASLAPAQCMALLHDQRHLTRMREPTTLPNLTDA